MQVYLVGGAIRDRLLGLPVGDRDFVVVGATVQAMLDAGYTPVGKDFPVFLHPTTHEQYALARTEKKVAAGYAGFTFYASPEVTLEQDLGRRDLTINAMAQGADGQLVDPYGGQQDLRDRLFRHVGEAFVEDPVRLLRVARFAAQFTNFEVAPQTLALMQHMVRAGEVDALVAERVWQELARGFTKPKPSRMLQVLEATGALPKVIAPMNLDSPAARAVLAAMDAAAFNDHANLLAVRWALLMQLLEPASLESVHARLRVSTAVADVARLSVSLRPGPVHHMAQSQAPGAQQLLRLLRQGDALRREARFKLIVFTWQALGYQHTDLLVKALAALQQVPAAQIAAKAAGIAVPQAIEAAQLATIEALLNQR
jgi:tRNA nucleotidyltransferase (CCA-adding enzyme)